MTSTKLKIIESVRVQTILDPWLSLRGLAEYSGLSVRKLRACLTHPLTPLPHYRVDGKVLVRRSEFDTWMQAFHHTPDVDRIVAEVLGTLPR